MRLQKCQRTYTGLRVLRSLVLGSMKETEHFLLYSQENARNSGIKDVMREQCVPALVDSWLQIMVWIETSLSAVW